MSDDLDDVDGVFVGCCDDVDDEWCCCCCCCVSILAVDDCVRSFFCGGITVESFTGCN